MTTWRQLALASGELLRRSELQLSQSRELVRTARELVEAAQHLIATARLARGRAARPREEARRWTAGA